MVKRATWLSVTPEPERELPEAVATLSAGGRAFPDAVEAERVRIERLVLHGSQRRWLAYLHDVVELIERSTPAEDPDVTRARARAVAVIANHHNLLLALPGAGARWTAYDRARLEELMPQAGPRLTVDDHGRPQERAEDHGRPQERHRDPQERAR
jgi:hypothetical protein